MYASYTIHNPSYFTADFMTRGSGNLTLYTPYGGSGTIYISVIGEKSNATLQLKVETGKVAARLGKFTVMHIICMYYTLLYSNINSISYSSGYIEIFE